VVMPKHFVAIGGKPRSALIDDRSDGSKGAPQLLDNSPVSRWKEGDISEPRKWDRHACPDSASATTRKCCDMFNCLQQGTTSM
jgi:hypothetical protein